MESIWSQSCTIPQRQPLTGDLEVEAAVIGGGMAGILTAFLLQEAGCQVAVVEAGRIASGQSRNTTAKITAQHGMIYQKLIRTLGAEGARQYARANQEAVQAYKALIREKQIPCDLEERCAYVYGSDAQALQEEVQAAASLGLPAEYAHHVPIPVPAAGAVRFIGQAQFHPLKFLRHLSQGLTVYEHTPVQQVEEDRLMTPRGCIKARHIVFACHFPFLNVPGLYFARLHQERSYVLALEGAPRVEGMYISGEAGGWSFRNWGDLLLLGGENHRTGESGKGGRYKRLRQKAAEWFPGSREVACWSAQDCITPDGVPYIGRYAASRPNWYVATGFQKWGMTTSMVSATILRDMIGGKESPYARVFAPDRLETAAIPGMAADGGKAVKGLAKRFFQMPTQAAEEIQPGEGGIVLWEGEKVGVYKDKDGSVHKVDIRCPHLECQLEWNPDEQSWDCPCHGSRFDRYGRLISGPAQEDIALD